jgi:uncharacterized protein (DUF1697 family)
MTTWLALVRGINVGGNRKLPMADLRAVFAEAGATDVVTYIQSGNVVFEHAARAPEKLSAELAARIEAATGFAVPVMLRSARKWAEVVANNPYPGIDPTRLHVVSLASEPAPGALDGIDAPAFAPEEFTPIGRELYLHLPDGMGRAKLPPALDRAVGVPGTARNWRTVLKLQELLAATGRSG